MLDSVDLPNKTRSSNSHKMDKILQWLSNDPNWYALPSYLQWPKFFRRFNSQRPKFGDAPKLLRLVNKVLTETITPGLTVSN